MRIYLAEGKESTNLEAPVRRKFIHGWIRFSILIALLFFVFRYAIGIEIINGNSMNPTIEDKSVLFTNKIFYTPDRGDIVVIQDPHGYSIIKRIIGMPHDKVLINNEIIYVNGEPLKETYTNGKSVDMAEVIVPEGEVFVVGDNRTTGESLDSRDPNVRTFPIKSIIGRAEFSIFPLHRLP
ncbi:signal peptidase I [Neobacillus vireti]|uniref:Signal peptidase I n=1 Tax=Neobacillus vireti LMG 21834 TaxID=1131730 RepID=A0AB94ISV9_9BACI|nr:signal peptidase I [Neobacillus vireti]ETI70126.1 signal peptidase I [Neobacillus vireti LMG 21834]KLT16494.1 hypothetical protein AA980_18695 [Neobacillus vireti]